LKIELRFAVLGRARFLSHLECVDLLLAAFRRADLQVALSRGMRPKPVISLAVARAVGVASEDELATVELVVEVSPDDVVERLGRTLPRGFELRSARESPGKPRPVAARYRVALAGGRDEIERAAAGYRMATEALVERRSPKGTKTVDAKRFADAVEVVEGGFEVEIAISQEGSARPEEVARAIEAFASTPLPVTGVTRIELRVERSVTVVGAPGESE
jgi:radical SAM-linked protein